MDEKDIQKKSIHLIESVESVVVSTIGPDGYPYATAVSNLRCSQLFPSLTGFFDDQNVFAQYMVTDTSSKKVAHIRANPKTALYFCKSDEYHGLMLGGDMEILHDRPMKQRLWQPNWEEFWPQGPDDPAYTLLYFSPVTATGWDWKTRFEFDPKG